MNKKRMMNFGKFLLAGVIALGMTACSSDDDVTGGSTNKKLNTYMTVQFASSTAQKTLVGADNKEEGSASENKVSDIGVALVQGGSVAQFQTIESADLYSISSPVGASTKPFPVQIGTYKVYVIVNYAHSGYTVTQGMTEAALKTLLGTPTAYAATADNFTMTNACNYSNDNTNIMEVNVTAANTEANPATTANPIKVDRLSVKVRSHSQMTTKFSTINGKAITVKQFVPGTDGAAGTWTTKTINSIDLVGYDLVNRYQKSFAYQQWDGNETAGFVQNLLTKSYQDQNYNAGGLANTKDTYRTCTYDATNKVYTALVDLVKGNNLNEFGTNLYTLENNPYETIDYTSTTPFATKTKYDNQTTGVLFKAQATFAGDNAHPTFFAFNGKYYADLASIQAEYPNVFDPLYTTAELTGETAPTAAQKLTAATALLNGTTDDANLTLLRTKCDIQVYENGVMYYSYFIKDNSYQTKYSTTADAQPENYYAVMRNSIYDLNVTSLLRIGDDIPFGWQPGDKQPIDKNQAYLKVEVSVNPWVLNTYSFPLK